MRASIRWLAGIICLFCLLGSTTALAANEYTLQADGYELVMWQMDWDSFDHTHSSFQTPEELLNYVKEGANEIAHLVGRSNWMDQYKVKQLRFATITSTSFSSTATRPTINLNTNWLGYNMAPIYHELTHIICPNRTSRSLREGLCSYTQSALGGMPCNFTYGMDPHIITANLICRNDKADKVIASIGSFDHYSPYGSGEMRACFYTASHSFAAYLIDSYGMDVFMNLYTSANEDAYHTYYGKSHAEIHAEWLRFLETNYASDFSREDYETYLYATLVEHGWSEELANQATPSITSLLAP